MDVKIEESWKRALATEFDRPYFEALTKFVKDEYRSKIVYPPPKFIFAALDACPFDKVKVVILGQDPYHGRGQANGLCFSVGSGVAKPPSLQNIYQEIASDLGVKMPDSGDLSGWAKQGVLLLNATLTVLANSPGSHQHKGWEKFTDTIVRILSEKKEYLVFMLWGAYAQTKGQVIDREKHLVLEAPHPSPFSADRGFFGSRHFSQANTYLEKHHIKPIDWASI